MKCLVCGAPLGSITTDLPLKVGDHTIVVVKKLPVLQCDGCVEYLIEDAVMAKLDELLGRVDRSTEVRSFLSLPDRLVPLPNVRPQQAAHDG